MDATAGASPEYRGLALSPPQTGYWLHALAQSRQEKSPVDYWRLLAERPRRL